MLSFPPQVTAVRHQALTSEQLTQLPHYLKKWQILARSTQPVELIPATQAIHQLYRALGQTPPEVRFCQSPADIPEQQHQCLQDKLDLFGMVPSLESILGKPLRPNIETIREQFDQSIGQQLSWTIQMDLEEELRYYLRYPVYTWQLLEHLSQTEPALHHQLHEGISLDTWLENMSCHDFCIDVLDCDYNPDQWEMLRALVQYCSWILPYDKVCFVCDRPRRLRLNPQGQLHGEGVPAVLFSDGLAIYAHGDVRLPEHYGKVHPHQWQARWILEEPNPTWQRVLIEGIGYGRLCQELPVQILDCWRECCLLQVDSTSGNPLVLLKMVCVNTGMTYVVRVPPHLCCAQTAARWANWGEEPERFAIAS